MKNNLPIIQFLSHLIDNHHGIYLKPENHAFFCYVQTEPDIVKLEVSGQGNNASFILSSNTNNEKIVFSLPIDECKDLLKVIRIKYCTDNKIFCEESSSPNLTQEMKHLILEEIENIKEYLKTYKASEPLDMYTQLTIKSKNGYNNKLYLGKLLNKFQHIKKLSSVGVIHIDCHIEAALSQNVSVIIPCEELPLYPELEKITKIPFSSNNIEPYIEKLSNIYPELSKKLLYFNMENNNQENKNTTIKNKI